MDPVWGSGKHRPTLELEAFVVVYGMWGLLASALVAYAMLTLNTPMMEYWVIR